MPLNVGDRLTHYDVTALIGEGGMGQVYQATDTKLNRQVALKILPEAFAADPDRLARFQREAQVLASLNHPNIAAIYGLEEPDDTRALVLELVEGPTLADRIALGPIPVDEALPIAKQIAEALEAAHEAGVIHRDLKPANIKVRDDGTVKVLDFGLAKALDPSPDADPSQSPTLTAAATQMGVIMGTAAYMSPEQARGKTVDKRADIWAFGVVLYEMLTGVKPFPGDDISQTLARVIDRDPDWEALPKTLPPALDIYLRRCLRREPRERIRDIGDVRLALEGAFETAVSASSEPAVTPQLQVWQRPIAALAAALALFVFGGLAVWSLTARAPNQAPALIGPTTTTVIDLPSEAPLALGSRVPLHGFDSPAVALSPDGIRLAYVGQSQSEPMLYLRELASGEITPLVGTEGAIHAFFSPDGQWIGFLTNRQVKKVSVVSQVVTTLADATTPVQAWWNESDVIYFSEFQGGLLSRVPADGSERSSPIIDEFLLGLLGSEIEAKFSDVLPGGQSVLATKWMDSVSADYAEIVLLDLETMSPRTLIRSGYGARYVPPGYLLFGRGGNLMAVRFDASSLEVQGDPVPVAVGAGMESLFGQVHATVSTNGLLVYAPGGDRTIGRLARIDRRTGAVEYLDGASPRNYGVLDLSPDGNRLAVHVAGVPDYIWIYDIEQHLGRRLSGNESHGCRSGIPTGFESCLRAFCRGNFSCGAWTRETATRRSFSLPDGGMTRGTQTGQPGRCRVRSRDLWDSRRSKVMSRSPRSQAGRTNFHRMDGGLPIPPGKRDLGGVIPRRVDPASDFGPWHRDALVVFETDFIDTPGISYDVSSDGQQLFVVKRADSDLQTKLHLVTNWSEPLRQAVGDP